MVRRTIVALEERLREAARATRARRGSVAIALATMALASCGVVALLWLGSESAEPSPSLERASSRGADPPPAPSVRLDDMAPPRRRAPARAEAVQPEAQGQASRVIGVGTGEFASDEPREASVVRVDGDAPAEEAPSDAEVRRQLLALEREQRKVEEALRGGQGPTTGTGELIWPVRGPITSPFGPRWGRLHAGLDIGAPTGRPVRAADAGRVVVRGPQGAYGNYVCVRHTRTLTTCYAHLSGFATSKGDQVRKGEVIAYVGSTGASTGPHLHFETRVNGKPVDPKRYL